MACYAALLSLFHTLNQIKIHPRPPISLDQSQVDSLTQNLTFLQAFLEGYSSGDDEELESRITAAAYAAEDVIETHIVDQIDPATSRNIGTVDLNDGLERVIAEMDLIKKEAMEIINNRGAQLYDHQPSAYSSVSNVSASSSSMTEFDDGLVNEVLDQLSGQQSNLQIISIDGMGGIGKTTFGTNIYSHPLIVECFDIRAWVTISQAYSSRKILLQVLCLENIGSEMSDIELGVRVSEKLSDRRYLIVMDDIWSIEAFHEVRCFFPNNKNGSRIMITTRLSRLAFELSGSHVFGVEFLDEGKSWGLLCDTVFGKGLGCPIELENIGKEIARNCKGLPLSIVVIGGHLKKSNWTRAHWEYTLQNLNSLINLEDGEFCLRILHTSYKELPIHLKPCFLYMGIFREDYKICVTKLIQLWVAEGILRPSKDKILEEVAQEYINELIDRNLIIVDKLRWNGKAKVCRIHDLLRDVCLREAQKQRFLYILKQQQDPNIPQCMNMERRICIHHNTEGKNLPVLESALLTRSLISIIGLPELVESHSFRLLKIASIIQVQISFFMVSPLESTEIWEMPLLRFVLINYLELPDPVDGENELILEYLQTLHVSNLKCSRAVIKRIPNIKTLKLFYGESEFNHDLFLNNISHLTKLQSLNISIIRGLLQPNLLQNLCFPESLKKLTLHHTRINWEECATKIGSLPLLQYLRLGEDALSGCEWETVEGGFCSLKILKLECDMLRHWNTEDTHFPCLEHLYLQSLEELEEIPSSIGDIPTLKSIRLYRCSKPAEDSAKRIEEEQRELGNMDLLIHIVDFVNTQKSCYNPGLFVKEVKETFKYEIEKYHGFVDVMTDYFYQRIDKDGLVRMLKVLFEGHPSLIHGFNSTLPSRDHEAYLNI